jgi:hypothetical protein
MERKYETRISQPTTGGRRSAFGGTSHERRATSDEFFAGSALILAVVLTSLLAVIGVVFLLSARIDKMAASAFSENRELDFAVETVVTKISRELALDVPGVPGPGGEMPEYYDYPDAKNAWLASLEPNDKRIWPQITDFTGFLGSYSRNVKVKVVGEYEPVTDFNDPFANADADGDGVGDSKWVPLPDVTSGKGKRINVAVRIIDLGGMLNANTAFKFDPADPCAAGIDGHSQMQINLMALAGKAGRPPTRAHEKALLLARANNGSGVDPCDLGAYERNIIWRYSSTNGPYTPFDIGDELELRYRFLLNHADIDARIEQWSPEFRYATLSTPVIPGAKPLDDWFKRAYGAGPLDPNYAYRHITTTYNMDRIINPLGASLNNRKMVNVNTTTADPNLLFRAIYAGLYDANFPSVDVAAQITANLIDFRDGDDSITVFDPPPPGGRIYYGFERPCIYISELAQNFVPSSGGGDPNHKSYAVELYKPYFEDNDPAGWQLVIGGNSIAVSWSGRKQLYVIRNEDPAAPLGSMDPNVIDSSKLVFGAGNEILLQRRAGGDFVTVDAITVPGSNGASGWLTESTGAHSIERDITLHKCIRRLWANGAQAKAPTLGRRNNFVHSDPNTIQAHPANKPFTNIGEIGMVFSKAAYYRDPADRNRTIGYSIIADGEKRVLVNLADPLFQRIFNYLTVIDPASHGQPAEETRVKGRINVNTAPWFVIAQLPWMWPHIAQATVAFRDKTLFPGGADYRNRPGVMGFGSIGELMNVAEMGYYTYDNMDLDTFPDLTPRDGDRVQGNFEERDIIFHRISNLVTVRSDVFTAYILVRIGADGPQRRVMAILDRSRVRSSADKVKIIALYPVPDPR